MKFSWNNIDKSTLLLTTQWKPSNTDTIGITAACAEITAEYKHAIWNIHLLAGLRTSAALNIPNSHCMRVTHIKGCLHNILVRSTFPHRSPIWGSPTHAVKPFACRLSLCMWTFVYFSKWTAEQVSPNITRKLKENTVKPPNKGHVGDGPFIPCREVVLFSEVLF